MHGFGGVLEMHGVGSALEMHGFGCPRNARATLAAAEAQQAAHAQSVADQMTF